MARIKPKNLFPIKDLAAANEALARIADLKRRLAKLDSDLNADIDRLKADAEAKAAPLQTLMASIEGGLLAFAEFNKDTLFEKKRSKELDFGVLGYRRSKELKPQPKITWKMVLGKLKDLGLAAGIRIREDVNKDELRQWPDERLALVGVRRVDKDSFYYEIDEQKIADKAA